MEKFTQWEDKSCGINPFVEFRPKRTGTADYSGVVLKILWFPLALLRMVCFAIVLPITILLDIIVSCVPIWFLQRPIKQIVVAPLCRIVLFLLGYLYISEKVPDPRRLRLGRLKKGTPIPGFGETVYSGDIIICNSTSFVEVLYLAYRFSCDFAVVCLPSGEQVHRCGLLGALKRAGASYEDERHRTTNASNPVSISRAASSASSNGASLAVFPEGVRSNGVALLKFASAMDTLASDSENSKKEIRKHLVAFKYSYTQWSPCHTVGSLSGYIFSSCFQIYNSMQVSMVPHEVRMLSYKNSMETSDENKESEKKSSKSKSSEADHIRSLLAMAAGERGVKLVNLGATEYFAFLDYNASTNAKRLERKNQ